MTATDKDIQQLFRNFREQLEAAQEHKFTFLLLGRTGVGKSSTVNSLIGKHIAEVDEFEPATATVKIYESTIEGVRYRIVDTPGLCDTDPQKSHDRYYLGLVRAEVPKFDCLWFVTQLYETRLGGDEPRGIRLITEALGHQVWGRAIIVFTFADKVSAQKYERTLEKRTKLIREAIAVHVGSAVANEIPAVAVSNVSATTPDKRLWLGTLYTTVITRISKSGFLPFFLATAERVGEVEYSEENEIITTHSIIDVFEADSEPPPILITENQKRDIIRQLDAQIVPGLMMGGAAIGSVFGPAGILVGGSVGAALGLVIWLFSK